MIVHKHSFTGKITDAGRIPLKEYVVELPVSAKILDAQMQYGDVSLWYSVSDSDAKAAKITKEYRFMFCFGSQRIVQDAIYIRTFQFCGGSFVLHLFYTSSYT